MAQDADELPAACCTNDLQLVHYYTNWQLDNISSWQAKQYDAM